MDFYIRRMNRSDADSVKQLIEKALYHRSMMRVYEPSEMVAWVEAYDSEGLAEIADTYHAYVLLDRDSGRLLASGYIKLSDDNRSAYIGMVFTDPEFQGLGLGKRIIGTLEQDEYATTVDRIALDSSLSGYRFYHKLGYTCKDNEYQLVEARATCAVPLEKLTKDIGKILREND